MKFSESWLREWVNPALTTNELAEQISMAGLEVDGVDAVAGEFSQVFVGEVVDASQHPDADKLKVTKVNVGGDELIDIVCGAPNCRTGLKVAVAVVGAVLPGDFKIKKAKLRGQPSFGMLCSFSELGISDDHDGIIELPSDAPIGMCLREYLQLDDHALEVDLTPNRADCLGIKGIAREVGVLNQLDVCQPVIESVAGTIDTVVKVNLDAPEACPRYLARVIRNVDLSQASPLWMQERLRRSGIRSIDAVVDVTNYVLLELGHPMHAFDYRAISGDIHVRFAHEGETLTLLDGNEVTLQTNTLVIADADKALAMAGVFGGADSGVQSTTQDILLEAAFFSPDAILGKARQYGLHTDASHRYERGVDFTLQRTAMERATALLIDIVGGQAGPITEAVAEQYLPARNTIICRESTLTRRIGYQFPTDTVTEIFQRLGFQAQYANGQWQVKAPSYRFDIAIEEDLIEEVTRIFGYNNIPNQLPAGRLTREKVSEAQQTPSQLKNVLLQQGYYEAITYSFVDPKKQTALFNDQTALVLPHPISADMSAMRVSLITGLLDTMGYNQKRQQNRIRLFETGLKFVADEQAENGVAQIPMIAGVVSGGLLSSHWQGANDEVDFFAVKGDVERLLATTGYGDDFVFVKSNKSHLHPGQGADIYLNNKCVGFVGALHPQFEKIFGLQSRAFVFELEQAALLARALPRAKAISKYPSIKRDLAFVISEKVQYADIIKEINDLQVANLVHFDLFDVYRGANLPSGHQSLALSLTFVNVARTLAEEEVQQAVEQIVKQLASSLNAELRD